jgi:hypothetical protein
MSHLCLCLSLRIRICFLGSARPSSPRASVPQTLKSTTAAAAPVTTTAATAATATATAHSRQERIVPQHIRVISVIGRACGLLEGPRGRVSRCTPGLLRVSVPLVARFRGRAATSPVAPVRCFMVYFLGTLTSHVTIHRRRRA